MVPKPRRACESISNAPSMALAHCCMLATTEPLRKSLAVRPRRLSPPSLHLICSWRLSRCIAPLTQEEPELSGLVTSPNGLSSRMSSWTSSGRALCTLGHSQSTKNGHVACRSGMGVPDHHSDNPSDPYPLEPCIRFGTRPDWQSKMWQSRQALSILSRCQVSSTDRQLHKLHHVPRVSGLCQLYLQVPGGSIVLCTQFCKIVPTHRQEWGVDWVHPRALPNVTPPKERSLTPRRYPQDLLSASLSRVCHRLLGQLNATVNCVLDAPSKVPERSSAKSCIVGAGRW